MNHTHWRPPQGPPARRQAGSGTLALTGENTFNGLTTIAAGTLQIGADGTTGSLAGDVLNSGELVFSRSDDVTFGGSMTGTGGLTKPRSSAGAVFSDAPAEI